MNLKLLTLVLIILSLLLAALLARNGDLAWMALPFLFYLGTGVLHSPSSGDVHLQAERQVSQSTIDGIATVDVRVTVRNQGGPVDQLCLADPLPEGTRLVCGENRRWMALRSGEEAELSYSFQEKRGRYQWATVQAAASDPFSLIEMEIDLPARGECTIQPQHDTFRRLHMRPSSTLHAPGSIPARLGGSGTDFWGVREYHTGDSLRWLDWRLTARHPGQFFTKEFEQEEIADIGLILDARQKTDLRLGEDSLFDHSVGAAASLAEAFLHQGHRVSLLALNETTSAVFPGYGKVQLNRILHVLAQIRPGTNDLVNSLKYLPLRMFSSHALLVVISPLSQVDWPFFPRLRSSGYQALVISPDPLDFIAHTIPQDRVSQLAFRSVRLERRLELRDITRLHIPVIDWQVSRPLFPLVRMAISRTRGQRER